MDAVSETMSGLAVSTAVISSKMTAFDDYQERAEAVAGKVGDQVQGLENRMTALEALEVKKYEDRLEKHDDRLKKAEGTLIRMLAIGSTLYAATAAAGGFGLWYFSNVASQLAG